MALSIWEDNGSMLEGEEALAIGDMAPFVKDLPVSLLEGQLARRQETPRGYTYDDEYAYQKLQRVLKDPFLMIPQWMRNPNHRQLALRLVASTFWETTPRKTRFNLKKVKTHFRDTDRENRQGPQEYERRFGKPYKPH